MSIFSKLFSCSLAISAFLFSTATACERCEPRKEHFRQHSIEFIEVGNPEIFIAGILTHGTYITRSECGEKIDSGTFVNTALSTEGGECNVCQRGKKITIARLFGQCGVLKAVLFEDGCGCEDTRLDFEKGYGIYSRWKKGTDVTIAKANDSCCHVNSLWKFCLHKEKSKKDCGWDHKDRKREEKKWDHRKCDSKKCDSRGCGHK